MTTAWWLHEAEGIVRMFRAWVSAYMYPQVKHWLIENATSAIPLPHKQQDSRNFSNLQMLRFKWNTYIDNCILFSTIVDKVIHGQTKPGTKPNFAPQHLMMQILLNVHLQCLNALQA